MSCKYGLKECMKYLQLRWDCVLTPKEMVGSEQDFLLSTDVKNLVSTCDIKRSLVEHRNKIQTLSDETAVSMKKNVYRNYKQFIDTSKEISCILSHKSSLSAKGVGLA